jgi:hypothetical protein
MKTLNSHNTLLSSPVAGEGKQSCTGRFVIYISNIFLEGIWKYTIQQNIILYLKEGSPKYEAGCVMEPEFSLSH